MNGVGKVSVDPREIQFQTALQAAFGARCADFSGDLRDVLREFYMAGHQDGRKAFLRAARKEGLGPSFGVGLKTGHVVEDFEDLRTGMALQNPFLRLQGHVRVIEESTAFQCRLVQSGSTVRTDVFSEAQFKKYGPYTLVKPQT